MHKRNPLAVLLLMLIAAGLIAGCASQPVAEPAAPCVINGCHAPVYRIGPGDVLQVSVWQDKNFNRTEPVRPDGMISLPLINEVQAAGLTPLELQHEIAKKLTKYLSDPNVSVVVTAVHSISVSVLGQVLHPGSYQFPVEPTALEAIAAAGGLTPFASSSDIVIVRQDRAGTERIPFDYARAVSKGKKPVLLAPNDVVVVP